MLQNPDQSIPSDFNSLEEFDTTLPRRALLPMLMHISITVVLIFSLFFAYIWVNLAFEIEHLIGDASFIPAYRIVMLTVAAICLATSAGCILLWCRWKYAVSFIIFPACFILFLLFFALLGTVQDRNWIALAFSILYLIFQLILTIRLFKIRKEWKKATRK